MGMGHVDATATETVSAEEPPAKSSPARSAEPEFGTAPGHTSPARHREGYAPEHPAQRLLFPGEPGRDQDADQDRGRASVPGSRPDCANASPARKKSPVSQYHRPNDWLEESHRETARGR